jgi:hypothetical protein
MAGSGRREHIYPKGTSFGAHVGLGPASTPRALLRAPAGHSLRTRSQPLSAWLRSVRRIDNRCVSVEAGILSGVAANSTPFSELSFPGFECLAAAGSVTAEKPC